MGAPEPADPAVPSGPSTRLDGLVENQALAVLAALDDLTRDLDGSLHDARVAIRRLRSSLAVFEPLLRDDDAVRALADDLRWLARELGQARDDQVVRIRIVAALDALHASDLEKGAVLDHLGGLPGGARARAALSDARFANLRTELDLVRLRGCAEPSTADPESVRAQVWIAVREVVARSERRPHGGARKRDRQLHRLRKHVKVVRTALRAVRVAPPGSGKARVVHALDNLQDLLGEHQDAVVTEQVLLAAGQDARVRDLATIIARAESRAAKQIRVEVPDAVRRLHEAASRFERHAASAQAGPS